MVNAIAISFRLTGDGKAAITADFVMTAGEVNPVPLASYRRPGNHAR